MAVKGLQPLRSGQLELGVLAARPRRRSIPADQRLRADRHDRSAGSQPSNLLMLGWAWSGLVLSAAMNGQAAARKPDIREFSTESGCSFPWAWPNVVLVGLDEHGDSVAQTAQHD